MSERWVEVRVDDATSEEMAAIVSAIRAMLAEEGTDHSRAAPTSRWVRRGRLEAQGMTVTDRALRRAWSVE